MDPNGVDKINLAGIPPVIEYRCGIGKYFVTYPSIDQELVMAFTGESQAIDLARNVFSDTPFFSAIPVVPHRTAYPRPWLEYPPLSSIEIPVYIVA